jgi:hypothetical protein
MEDATVTFKGDMPRGNSASTPLATPFLRPSSCTPLKLMAGSSEVERLTSFFLYGIKSKEVLAGVVAYTNTTSLKETQGLSLDF